MKNAPFIVFDGMDGSGKGTQIKLLVERAMREGRKFVTTREPGGTPFAEGVRTAFEESTTSARTQSLAMWAARSDLLEKVIIPALNGGTPVFDDRSDSSTWAYQVEAMCAPELGETFFKMRNDVFGEHKPTLYLLFDLPAVVSQNRVNADADRVKSPFDMKPLAWYERVREGFHAFRGMFPENVVIVDANRPIEVIHGEVYRIVADHCGWK